MTNHPDYDPMVVHAQARGQVRLSDGRLATLVCWHRSGSKRGQARIELPNGRRATVRIDTIVEVLASGVQS